MTQSLRQACDKLASIRRLLRNTTVLQRNLPPLDQAVAQDWLPAPPQIHASVATSSILRSSLDQHESGKVNPASQVLDYYGSREALHRQFDTLPPISPETMKRASNLDSTPRRPQSPHRSSTGSAAVSLPSPLHSQHSARTLPSPSTIHTSHTSSAVTGTFSPPHGQYAPTTHMLDLQHQISTKSLALQTLQREHDQLLAAFSRSQMRCSTLDKKSQVSDHEINTLTEEKLRLQQQVEALESQVEDLVIARDDAQRQATVNSAQWQQIMTMSSQLEVKGVDESKKYRAHREAWDRDRAGLQQRIQHLETGRSDLLNTAEASSVSQSSSNHDDVLTSANLDVLRKEIVRLRNSCAEMETALRNIREKSEQKLNEAMAAIATIRDSFQSKPTTEDISPS